MASVIRINTASQDAIETELERDEDIRKDSKQTIYLRGKVANILWKAFIGLGVFLLKKSKCFMIHFSKSLQQLMDMMQSKVCYLHGFTGQSISDTFSSNHKQWQQESKQCTRAYSVTTWVGSCTAMFAHALLLVLCDRGQSLWPLWACIGQWHVRCWWGGGCHCSGFRPLSAQLPWLKKGIVIYFILFSPMRVFIEISKLVADKLYTPDTHLHTHTHIKMPLLQCRQSL